MQLILLSEKRQTCVVSCSSCAATFVAPSKLFPLFCARTHKCNIVPSIDSEISGMLRCVSFHNPCWHFLLLFVPSQAPKVPSAALLSALQPRDSRSGGNASTSCSEGTSEGGSSPQASLNSAESFTLLRGLERALASSRCDTRKVRIFVHLLRCIISSFVHPFCVFFIFFVASSRIFNRRPCCLWWRATNKSGLRYSPPLHSASAPRSSSSLPSTSSSARKIPAHIKGPLPEFGFCAFGFI